MIAGKNDYPFGNLLASLRNLAGLQQIDMIKKLRSNRSSFHENTYRNWEKGNNLPNLRDVQEIAKILQLEGVDKDETDRLFKALSQTPPKLWTVPYNHNPLFTGRERILQLLAKRLVDNHMEALVQAISGLGGIGKTQIAVEYAYRHRDNYRSVLWANADSHNALVSSYVTLANQLNLPEKDVEEQTIVVEAVKQWLAGHTDWLLIIDNADDVAFIYDFLPLSLENGHTILTTRSQAHGPLAQSIAVDKMTTKAGVLFLLKRAKKVEPGAQFEQLHEVDIADAKKLVSILGGLPLALDQAGAYIEETGCSVVDYLDRYRRQRGRLLQRRSGLGKGEKEHPASIASTLALSFEKVKQQNPIAVSLLQFCAFLPPEAIPEQLLLESMPYLSFEQQTIVSDPFVLDELVEALRAYSLIERNATIKHFSIHRLVQVILQDEMEEREQRQWAERVVCAVEHIFPNPSEIKEWPLCQQYLLPALTCAALIEEKDIALPEAVSLLNRVGKYLVKRARYREAEPLILRAWTHYKQLIEPKEHTDLSTILENLLQLYRAQGKYEDAEQILHRELSLSERVLGPEHPNTISCLNDLGVLYHDQGKYEQAILLLEQVLVKREKILETGHSAIAQSLDNLALLYSEQGNYEKAELLNKRALSIWEQQPVPNNPDTATCLNNLGTLYVRRGMDSEAEPLLQRALEIRMQILGAEHTETAISLHNLAELYREQGKYLDAESLYKQALSIYENCFDSGHPDMIPILENLAVLYCEQQNYSEVEPVYKRAVALSEQHKGREHPDTANTLSYLAVYYEAQGASAEAESLYQRALMTCQKVLGAAHPQTIISTNNFAEFYDAQGEYEKAELLYRHVSEILEQDPEQDPMYTYRIAILLSWAEHYAMQGKQREVEQLFQKAVVIHRQRTGLEDMAIIETIKSFAPYLGIIHYEDEIIQPESQQAPFPQPSQENE